MLTFKTLRTYVFEVIDTYEGIKGELNQLRSAQLDRLKAFCQVDKNASDDAIRRYVQALIAQINKVQASRWIWSRKPSQFAQMLSDALDHYDRQQAMIPMPSQSYSYPEAATFAKPKLLSITNG